MLAECHADSACRELLARVGSSCALDPTAAAWPASSAAAADSERRGWRSGGSPSASATCSQDDCRAATLAFHRALRTDLAVSAALCTCDASASASDFGACRNASALFRSARHVLCFLFLLLFDE